MTQILSYRHPDKRVNNPEVGIVTPRTDPPAGKTRWCYDPHLDPALQFDFGRAQVEKLIDDALASGDPEIMRATLEELKRYSAPYLNWAGKAERTSFEVDTVSLHVHERIDPLSILSVVRKTLTPSPSPARGRGARGEGILPPSPAYGRGAGGEGILPPSPVGRGAGGEGAWRQPGLFDAPFENLPLRDAIDFYRHEKGWANRLIAGDSLLVMNSLLQKESMAGRVQMIYIDPPYGIKYGSNFQPFVNKRDVKDRSDEDLTREPEQIRAFRDTWELGIHSYLTYLRDRLLLARELLHESGSIFVQISDENLHHVRELMDEVFGAGNFVSIIAFRTTAARAGGLLDNISDYVLWYGKERRKTKYRQIFIFRPPETESNYDWIKTFDGIRQLTTAERWTPQEILGGEKYALDNLTSQGFTESGSFNFEYEGEIFAPNSARHWATTHEGMKRLAASGRLQIKGKNLFYRRFLKDYPVRAIPNIWDDTALGGFLKGESKIYVVQTNTLVIERCLLMTTDPGDLVFDPTCGSGTTAYVAEKWGRRWITCDTSRVAITLAKQRLMTASFDYYALKYPHEGLKGGFIYKTVPHVTLKSIANNPEIDAIYERMHPAIEQALAELNAALQAPLSPSPLSPLPRAGEGKESPSLPGEGKVWDPQAGEAKESPSPACGRRVWDEGSKGSSGELAYHPNPPARLPEDLKQHAREMRHNATDAEHLMWQLLRNRRLANAKFRRQHPIGRYIVDFYCHEHRLVIELDGGQHAEQKSYDEQRTAYLEKQGLRVLRFWNNQVLNETEAVLQVIWEALTLTPTPLPQGEEGNKIPSPLAPLPSGEGDNMPSPLAPLPSGEGNNMPLPLAPLPQAGEGLGVRGLREWEVPFDFPADWPEAARAPFEAFHAARQAMQREMDRSIAAHAEQEILYDQPTVDKTKLRITGPFTVEAVPFPSVKSLDTLTPCPSPDGRGEQNALTPAPSPTGRRGIEFEADASIARMGESGRQHQWREELLKTGIRGRGGQVLRFADLEALPSDPSIRHLHAVGHLESGERVVVSFGPEHAALEQRQVAQALTEAEKLRPQPAFIVFCAFAFDPEAAKDIDETRWPGVTLLKAQMNTDLLTEDLKKARPSNQSFWLVGQPDVEVRRVPPPSPTGRGVRGEGNWYVVEVHGFDYFDTVKGELISGGKGKIAMWLLDTDYDERSLFPRQVFFPMAGKGEGWERLKKTIRAELDEDKLAAFHGTVSLPFEAGENRKIAVKIIDDRGIESLKVLPLED